MKVAVVGAGLIGQAWAIVFARGGCEVSLWDGNSRALDNVVPGIARRLSDLKDHGLVSDVDEVLKRLQATSSLADALAGSHYVQENLPEVLELKAEIFGRMDALAPGGAILASSTSGFPASAFTQGLAGRQRCLIAHPVNPPYLIPVVELCGAPWTSPAAIEGARSLMDSIGQRPVVVKREIDGFILNRLQGALLQEAFWLVENGYVDAAGLDATVSEGLGLRWAFMGPIETIDLNAPSGLSDYCQRYGGMYQSFEQSPNSRQMGQGWSAELVETLNGQRRETLPISELADRQAWRDRRLMQLMVHKQQAVYAEDVTKPSPEAECGRQAVGTS
ncbi:3-hydroxyacyl-CoA dehydrogenase [Variovorax sp. J22G21]|uniref:3-hydroxyacyl-CoA dehydrogenase n=1 Tax=Variovorax fucosicus TaxID=3053517 RepID=UPI0025759A94|nr:MULTISPECIES: 3-hydroxyacyl-CoA dehydrogenase [unclassified Variovorax]MDM0042805.1 3-hydroxyacyl-CoA dehydrogenase [Variovorax sp. J22R193]MDM0064862.1 3-hydroxyacyl-CoA dehydrogenase [Variovorax sp. J22G21]